MSLYTLLCGVNFMDNQKKINDFISDVENEMKKQNLDVNDFCIIIYAGNLHGNRWVKFIYKTIEDFKEKSLNDIRSIDVTYSVDLQMWIFD